MTCALPGRLAEQGLELVHVYKMDIKGSRAAVTTQEAAGLPVMSQPCIGHSGGRK